jgi:ABC-type phosphate transport system auxiliary subunit
MYSIFVLMSIFSYLLFSLLPSLFLLSYPRKHLDTSQEIKVADASAWVQSAPSATSSSASASAAGGELDSASSSSSGGTNDLWSTAVSELQMKQRREQELKAEEARLVAQRVKMEEERVAALRQQAQRKQEEERLRGEEAERKIAEEAQRQEDEARRILEQREAERREREKMTATLQLSAETDEDAFGLDEYK